MTHPSPSPILAFTIVYCTIKSRIKSSQYKKHTGVTGSVSFVPKWVTILTCRTVTAGSGMLVTLAIAPAWRDQHLTRDAGGSPAHSGAQRSTLARPCEVADMIPSCPFRSQLGRSAGIRRERSSEKRSSKGREDGSAWDARPFIICHTFTRAAVD